MCAAADRGFPSRDEGQGGYIGGSEESGTRGRNGTQGLPKVWKKETRSDPSIGRRKRSERVGTKADA